MFPAVRVRCLGLFVLFTAIPTSTTSAADPPPPADFVLTGGRIVTLDAKGSIVQAIAIRDEKIVYLGNDAGAKPFIGPKTKQVDAHGRTVVPGINETHVHATGVALGEATDPFRQLHSIAEIQAWAREKAATLPEGQWVRLPRVDVTRIRERRFPTPAELDEACPDRPVVFAWMYANRQIQILNAAAMKVAGITRDTAAPKGGLIVRDSKGEPTGRIENCTSLVSKWINRPKVSDAVVLDHLEAVLRQYNRLGITSITERGSNAAGWQQYRNLRSQGRLPVRATVTIRIGGDGTVAGTERTIRALPFGPGEGDDWVKVGPLKIAVDGGVLYGTAYLREPYGPQSFALYGLSDPAYRGLLQMDAESVKNAIRTGHRLGWQMSSHVTGDAGVDMVLDAVEAANADSPITDRRFTLIHAYFPSPDIAARAAKLGVIVDTQPAWFYKDGDALAAALGGERMRRFIGLQEWLKAGVHVALNSDHMSGIDPNLSLNPYNPFLTLYAAIARKTDSGLLIGPEQRVSREIALRMMTAEAAYLHFDEQRKGTLELGRLGDLAVLSADYFSCSEEAIKDLHSLLTVVGGKVVHEE